MQFKSILLGLLSAGLLNAAPLSGEPHPAGLPTGLPSGTPPPKPTGSLSFTFTGTHSPKPHPTGTFSLPPPAFTPKVAARKEKPSGTPSFSKGTHTHPTGRPTGKAPSGSLPHPSGTGKGHPSGPAPTGPAPTHSA